MDPPLFETVYLLIILRIGEMIENIVFLDKFVFFLGLGYFRKPFHFLFSLICLIN